MNRTPPDDVCRLLKKEVCFGCPVDDWTARISNGIFDPSGAVRVLWLGEAAVRMGVSRAELDAMIDACKIEALPTGCTRMVPTSEVVRLTT